MQARRQKSYSGSSNHPDKVRHLASILDCILLDMSEYIHGTSLRVVELMGRDASAKLPQQQQETKRGN
jgi:hypothetical protein